MEGSVYQYYANVRTEPVEWLWYPYIPLGKLTVLQGDPGEGKSTFALNVVARITTGQPMPDGVPVKGKRVAIYQCAEDGIADTIKPRLQQAGADCERVAYIIDNDIALTLEDGRIETAIKDTHASVFIIDPIQAFIPPDADMQSATKMRSVLRKLANIADRNKCAVILIGHMNKGNGAKTLYRGLGSIDIAAIARSVLMISRDESRPDIRYMYPIKSSLAPEGPAIAFSFKEHGGIVWHGKYDLNTAELMDSITLKRIVKVRCVFRFQGGNQHNENTFFQARNCRTAFSRDVPVRIYRTWHDYRLCRRRASGSLSHFFSEKRRCKSRLQRYLGTLQSSLYERLVFR